MDRQYSEEQPRTAAQMRQELRGYRAPGARMAVLRNRGELLHLRRDLYVCREEGKLISEALIANRLVSQSYISFETALSWHGIIPERVHVIKSACRGRSRRFENAMGRYTYTQLSSARYYNAGLTSGLTNGGISYAIATPEKALCDLVLCTPYLRLQSAKAARIYLEDFLRADANELNPELLHEIALTAHKKRQDLLYLERSMR